MARTTEQPVSFADTDTRYDDMHSAIERWIRNLRELVDEAQASVEFQEWLDIQRRFHDYSFRNTLLIKEQCSEVTRVAGYRTWQEEFDRHVREGEQAIWIWAPIIAKRCTECENSPSYHEKDNCEYDGTPPEEWSKGLVGFRPVPVFDVSQTEGEPLPELETEATGDAQGLVSALLEAAGELDIDARIVDPKNWPHGEGRGVCTSRIPMSMRPLVEVKARSNKADLARTLIHEYAHAQLHFDVDEPAVGERDGILTDLFNIRDNFQRALDAETFLEDDAAADISEGIELIDRQIRSILEREGVDEIDTSGTFDQTRHRVVETVPTADAVPGEIVDVYQLGYRLDDRVLREAHVVVAEDPATAEDGTGTEDSGQINRGGDVS